MRIIETLPGDSIDHAARQLVAAAPARATFNGVPIRARYRTTKPGDIVARYMAITELRSIAWRSSPEGKRVAAETAARTAECQANMTRLVGELGAVDMTDPAAVLAWVEQAAEPSDRRGVTWDRAVVIGYFKANGWEAGVNCGVNFRADDARNFAGWVVGQWLQSGFPNVSMFAAQWRERFMS